MSIFGIIKSDDKVFTGDKIRFDFRQSFWTPDETASALKYEVSFDAGATYIDVTTNKYIDYIYSTGGTKAIKFKLSMSALVFTVFDKNITVLDLATAKLFSNDSDLYNFEPEIDNLLPKKWSGWNMNHYETQKYFMDWLDEKRIFNENGKKYVVADLMDRDQVRGFAVFKTLETIYSGVSNVVGDLYSIKRDKYRELANEKLAKSQISLDYNKNGLADDAERTDLHSVNLVRR